jgi:acetylornithine deacetylase/succinyl-diaminopimelate desuccinylase-like protein
MVIDRRMLPHESSETVTSDLRERLEKVKARIPEVEYRIEFIALNEATETPLDSPLVKALQRNYRDLRGVEAEIWGPPYGSDMRNFMVDAGIPTLNFGAGDFHRCHQPDEFVPVDDLLAVARVVFGTVIDFLESDRGHAG